MGPQPGIKPAPPALEAWSLTHWTTRDVPQLISNPKVRKALIVETTFESDPRRCIDTEIDTFPGAEGMASRKEPHVDKGRDIWACSSTSP